MRNMLLLLIVVLTLPFSALAQDTDEDAEPLMTGCEWKDVTLDFSGSLSGKLAFRYQYCDSSGAAKVGFTLDGDGLLSQTWNADTNPAAHFWLLKKGERPSAAIERLASPSIKKAEKGRCVVHLDMITGNYAYTPNARYLEELLDRDEPFGACGEFGDSNDSIQYWKVIDERLLGYLWIGQDTPIFDPKSFKYISAK